MSDCCIFKKCKNFVEILYLNKNLCWNHWEKLCNAGEKDKKTEIRRNYINTHYMYWQLSYGQKNQGTNESM